MVWHFEEKSVYHRRTRSGGLFTNYINTLFKIKQETSGWPSWCKNEQDREKYVSECATKEGIWLDSEKITYNPGLRALAKLTLNSF